MSSRDHVTVLTKWGLPACDPKRSEEAAVSKKGGGNPSGGVPGVDNNKATTCVCQKQYTLHRSQSGRDETTPEPVTLSAQPVQRPTRHPSSLLLKHLLSISLHRMEAPGGQGFRQNRLLFLKLQLISY